jgi:hypothetical protein
MNAMQRLDLMDQLDELIVSLEAASGLSKLDILDSIDAVMQKLGLGNTGDNPSPEPEPQPEPQPEPATESLPQVIQDFKAEKYKGMVANEFLAMLRQLREYVGGFVSFSEIAAGADEWYRTSPYFEG